MRHDKVFIVPERLEEIVPNNPNPLPWKRSEAFIAVPLFANGKCFAHFGMTWSSEGASRRQLGWNYIEMFMHSLEDMIVQRILEGKGLQKDFDEPDSEAAKVIPLTAITAAQSLKPYARTLSHELRTPMQGVVGMLDIMYSTVLDAIANQPNDKVRLVFQDLKSHIEVVQGTTDLYSHKSMLLMWLIDSSKRAVEAADNVVHAYDMNLEMPTGPITPEETDSGNKSPFFESQPGKPIPEGDAKTQSPMSSKRPRPDVLLPDGPPQKRVFSVREADVFRIYCSEETAACATATLSHSHTDIRKDEREGSRSPTSITGSTNPLHRRLVIRDFLRDLVGDILRNEHPTEEVHTEIELGEKIEVKTIGSRGEIQERTLYLEVESNVPEEIITEQHHLQFSLQKIIDNAIKFTESGSIYVKVRLGKNDAKIEVWVCDEGCGINEESKQYLFKPHFQQDTSISRARDGLGLSLFNAKAHIRKNLGGDVTLERSATEGPTRGSEFLIRLPMSPNDLDNETPIVGTPCTPSHQSNATPFWSDQNNSPGTKAPSRIGASSPLGAVPSSNPTLPRPGSSETSIRKLNAFNPNLAKDYPLNILLAEDNAINREVAIGSLRKLGYTNANIAVAFDGLEAVELYKESLSKPPKDRFNAILMDIWMPKMDGYQATTNIKEIADSVGESITTIAVTADITSGSVERAKAVGMEGFLAKPYKVLDFERLIIEHFTKRIEEGL